MNPQSPIVVEIDDKRFEIAPAQWQALECAKQDESDFILKTENRTFKIRLIDFDFQKGSCRLTIDGHSRTVRILRDIDVSIEKMGLNISHHKKQDIVKAPIPGLVTNIKVVLGEKVQKDTPLLILEAMKMENVISAPHAAIIDKIHVEVGQAVDRGVPLIELKE